VCACIQGEKHSGQVVQALHRLLFDANSEVQHESKAALIMFAKQVSTKEPYCPAKEPYLHDKTPYFCAKEPHFSVNLPYLCTNECYLCTKEPYLSEKDSHLSANER